MLYANYMQNIAAVASTTYSAKKKQIPSSMHRVFHVKILNSSLISTQALKKCDNLLPHNASLQIISVSKYY